MLRLTNAPLGLPVDPPHLGGRPRRRPAQDRTVRGRGPPPHLEHLSRRHGGRSGQGDRFLGLGRGRDGRLVQPCASRFPDPTHPDAGGIDPGGRLFSLLPGQHGSDPIGRPADGFLPRIRRRGGILSLGGLGTGRRVRDLGVLCPAPGHDRKHLSWPPGLWARRHPGRAALGRDFGGRPPDREPAEPGAFRPRPLGRDAPWLRRGLGRLQDHR